MKISFENVSKRFAYEWIFKNMNIEINSGDHTGITGPNGSGKSTFLRLLLGTVDPSEGKIIFSLQNKILPVSQVYNKFSFCAPYMDLPLNYTIDEILKFHLGFREKIDTIEIKQIIEIAGLVKSKNKAFKQFSSGMKQRFKLALCLCTESEIVVLDEPTTNLDEEGKAWFHDLIANYIGERTLIIATNEADDLKLCAKSIHILDYK